MLGYTVRRIAYILPVALAVSVFCFLLVHMAPGEPLDAILPPDAPASLVERLRADYGMDRPLPVQYALWLGKVVSGDLGISIATGRSVWSELSRSIANTLVLAAAASLIAFTIGLLLGVVAGYRERSWVDRLASAVAVTGISVPHYWLGLVLVIIFSVTYDLLPAMGAGPRGSQDWAFDWEHIRFVILPAVTLAVIPMGIVMRSVRANVADILGQEFVVALRGKGLSERRVALHVLKNAAPASLAVIGVQAGHLLGGSILIEAVFSWPGTGMLLHGAIFQRDVPVLQSTTLVLALFFVLMNLLVDITQSAVDPRIRRS